ncbi:MAG: hypothetical protein M1833_002590 [Piccolia ochrophora]|nr:MAG: hypothetical protein M1833_002590 [Piccolia ochrophora]
MDSHHKIPELVSDYVSTDRLALKPSYRIGLLSKMRTSSANTRALPDLTFAKMRSLQASGKARMGDGKQSTGQTRQPYDRDDKEISTYFTSARKKLGVLDVNVRAAARSTDTTSHLHRCSSRHISRHNNTRTKPHGLSTTVTGRHLPRKESLHSQLKNPHPRTRAKRLESQQTRVLGRKPNASSDAHSTERFTWSESIYSPGQHQNIEKMSHRSGAIPKHNQLRRSSEVGSYESLDEPEPLNQKASVPVARHPLTCARPDSPGSWSDLPDDTGRGLEIAREAPDKEGHKSQAMLEIGTQQVTLSNALEKEGGRKARTQEIEQQSVPKPRSSPDSAALMKDISKLLRRCENMLAPRSRDSQTAIKPNKVEPSRNLSPISSQASDGEEPAGSVLSNDERELCRSIRPTSSLGARSANRESLQLDPLRDGDRDHSVPYSNTVIEADASFIGEEIDYDDHPRDFSSPEALCEQDFGDNINNNDDIKGGNGTEDPKNIGSFEQC